MSLFHLLSPDLDVTESCLYFLGNSLGLQPKKASKLVETEMSKWASRGARGHLTGQYPWMPIEDIVAKDSAKLVGCKPEEVTAMNTLTVNIHFLLVRKYYTPYPSLYTSQEN